MILVYVYDYGAQEVDEGICLASLPHYQITEKLPVLFIVAAAWSVRCRLFD